LRMIITLTVPRQMTFNCINHSNPRN
jgi:hypothetical protein